MCNFAKPNIDLERVKKSLQKLKLDHLNSDTRKQIESICAKYSDIFYIDGDKLGTTNIMTQSIELKPNTKPYTLLHSSKPVIAIGKEVKKMLNDDIIETT